MSRGHYFRYYLLFGIVVIAIWSYYSYESKNIPQKVAQSITTIEKVDSIRFTFKVALLAQKGVLIYVDALKLQDINRYYDALDQFEAAAAFINISYTKDQIYHAKVMPILDKIIHLTRNKKLRISQSELAYINTLVNDIDEFSELREREIWNNVQKNYITFRTNEYKIAQLYRTIAFGAFIFLIIVTSQLYYLNRLLRDIRHKESALKKLAFYDSLTNTANRKLIETELEKKLDSEQSSSQQCFVIIGDIDNFKRINDLLGHPSGDKIIVETAHRLKAILRQNDKLGRLGGDEFLLLLSEISGQEELISRIQTIQDAFVLPMLIESREFAITLSFGVSSTKTPDGDYLNVQEVIKNADIAMHKAKQEGKNRYHIYNKQLSEILEQEHQLETEIKRGILHNEFELYFQPQINMRTGQLTGVEALVRWNHPTRGLLLPREFIEVVERGILVKEFGEWVIREAIVQQQKWLIAGIDLHVSINLSAKHILTSDFLPSMKKLVVSLNADLKRLHFEITEYELISHQSVGIENLNSLNGAGFSLFLDDFGTGYSSISYLEKIPVSGIKIDKKFIDYIDSSGNRYLMVNGILTIAKAMGIKVVAEGVETGEQFKYLAKSHCDYLQGYLISKPLAVRELEQFVKHQYKNVIEPLLMEDDER
ncbi:putative bifunctional diguanylate cyclase/phosphodiesterase [Vibrio quintilis]|uniref:Cyclic di-GMP phosphodiesterase Gmr n=1 Tax=Vibrio quintilis TaxID=1117707 RepID=A0A1M7YQY6_9VIBR|nr:bifunctional diguanylate cyclase/phosphodiesterase [Vibrio quintilis]SHO55028.1 Cyclic di-GMP phosphodiesterase Gmr [Vibrio quintilis]